MSVQTTYNASLTPAFAGMLADSEDVSVLSMFNDEASASVAFGRAVMFGSVSNKASAKLPTSESVDIAGIVMHSHAYAKSDLDAVGLLPDATMNVLRKGKIWVTVEDAVQPGDRLWVRAVAGGDPEFLGGLLPADDGTDTVDCTNFGQFLTAAAAGGLAILEVNF
jgi:hypothetical protein